MDKEAIREELNKVREEIKALKSEYSKKKEEKEDYFKKGEEYSEEIDSLYKEVKKIEEEHSLDKINTDLEEKKTEYEELKKSLNEFEESVKNIKSSFRQKRPEIKTISVEKARSEINKLDIKLQTQVLSLEKESELLKKIAQLKEMTNLYSGNSENGEDSESKKLIKELRSVKRKYINAEKSIRSLYKQIRLISKEKKQRYKRIDELRDMKKKSFEEFRIYKKDYSKVGKSLKDLFRLENELLSKLGESPVQRKKLVEKNIKIKQKEIEEKLMKKGQILTTDDLLMFQSKK